MSIFTYIKSHVVMASTVAVVAVVVAVIAGRAASSSSQAADQAPAAKLVTLVDASSFRNGTSTISVDGVVEAHDQADLKSQIGAPIAVINVAVGDTVYPGQVILELQNSDIRAQLESSQASLALAQGQYGTTRQGAIDKMRDAYLSADNAVHATLDPLILTNLGTNPPLFAYYMTDVSLGNQIKDNRSSLTSAFTDWKIALDALSATSTDQQVLTVVTLSGKNMDTVLLLLDEVSQALNKASNVALSSTQTTITGLQTSVATARGAVSTAKSGLTAAASTLVGTQTGGGSAAQAQVAVAQAGVRNLQAQLAKTIVKSSITGKISALPLRENEFAAPGTLLATVVGSSNNLEVKAYASGEDFSRIKVGAKAIIDGSAQGTVSNVAPSVSADNQKAEVDIDVIDSDHSGLVVGKNVQVKIAAIPAAGISSGSITYLLPIQNVKIVPGNAYVLTVDADSKIVAHQVALGSVFGDFIQVTSGLDDSMKIVSPVYELNEGETVTVQQ